MIVQQLKELINRSIVLPVSSAFSGLTVPDPESGKFIRWKSDLSGLENADVTGQGAIGLPVSIANGGTNATTEAAARVALAVAGLADDNSLSGNNTFGAGTKQLFRGAVAFQDGLLTIASGAVTASRAAHVVAAETGTADDLDNIATFSVDDGALLVIRPDTGDAITVKDAAGGAGQIHLADNADHALSGDNSLTLQRRGADWYELARSARPASTLPGPAFESSELAVNADTLITSAHSLGAAPTLVLVFARCKTTDLGYAVGDEVLASSITSGGADLGVTIAWDATNVYIVQGSTPIYLHGKATFNRAGGTVGNWKWIIRAWA